jgi:aspartate--ammonia ligase
VGAEKFAQSLFPQLNDYRFPNLPQELEFFHAEEILDMYPDLPRKQRETEVLKEHPAIFIIGIGWPLKDGYPHEMRAADYDDWITDTHDPPTEIRMDSTVTSWCGTKSRNDVTN